MGEHRKRILGQFVLENLVPVLIALVFAALCATPTAEYFADRMISNQAEKVEQEMKICREILKTRSRQAK